MARVKISKTPWIAGGVAALLVLAGCAASDEDIREDQLSTALGQMEVAFEGHPAQSDIQSVLDPALEASGTAINEDSYSRAGSTLVGLRKQNGGTEMEILECMPTVVGDPRMPDDTFPSLAALCSLTTTGQL